MNHVTPISVRAVLRTNQANGTGLCPISICVTIGGKRAYVATGLRVKETQWEAGRVINYANASHYNVLLTRKLNEAEAELMKAGVDTIDDARRILAGDRGGGSFIEYAERVLPTLDIAPNTLRRWGFDLAHIRNYAPELKWGQITPAWCTAFNKHLCVWMQQNSARKTFVFIRRIFNEAREDGTTKLYPFAEWKLPAEVSKPKLYLTLEETDRIRALLTDRPDLPASMRCTIAHFLLECYSGIRHSDWGKWQTERLTDGESFHLTTTKTGEPIYLPLKDSPRLRGVVDYIRTEGMRYTYTNQDANRVLKEVARMDSVKLGKHITTHTGRHTAATLLLEKGFSMETVAEVLGVSIKVIMIYAKMTRQKVRTEFEKIGGL